MSRIYAYVFLGVLFSGLTVLSSCRKVTVDSSEKEAFLNCSRVGLYPEGVSVFAYSEQQHQLCVNGDRIQFRLQTNRQDTCMNIILEGKPQKEGNLIMASLDYDDTDVRISSQFQLECSRISDDKVWLWDPDAEIGVIIPDIF